MRSVLLSLLLLCLTGLADAQAGPEKNSNTVYFVVDVSGSMKTRLADAEHALAQQFAEIVAADPTASFSRTEFRAKIDDDCDKEIEISEPQPANLWPDPPSERTFDPNDFTPLGSALQAAITHAGKGPAEIYLASDWAQSPSCGLEVQDALRSIKPDANIAIIPVVVRATDSDLETARGAKRSSLILIGGTSDPKIKHEGHEPEKGPFSGLIAFIEAWLWFFGFVALSGLALQFGWKNTKQAIQAETRTKEIKSLQRAALYDQNKNAEQKLQKILRGVARDRKRADLLQKHIRSPIIKRTRQVDKLRSWFWRKWKGISSKFWPWQVLAGILVGLLLFVVAALPRHLKWRGFDFEDIRRAAWRALNSDFATAFAIIWIVTIFFAARQFQRRGEIDEEFSLATDEAGWVALAEERRAKKEAWDQYRATRGWVEAITFKDPWYVPSKFGVDEDALEILKHFEAVKDHARDLALQDPIDESTATKKQYENETERLGRYAKWRQRERSTVALKKFVSELLADQKIGELSTNWSILLETSSVSRDELIDALRSISSSLLEAENNEPRT